MIIIFSDNILAKNKHITVKLIIYYKINNLYDGI